MAKHSLRELKIMEFDPWFVRQMRLINYQNNLQVKLISTKIHLPKKLT